MCTSPLLIRNKKFRALSVKIPNSYIKVPCGQCDECLRKRAKDLFIRARFQVEHDALNGGSGFMCCLTYDNNTLPLLHHLGKTYMVFNKRDIMLFLKRLRTNLDRFFMFHFKKSAPDFKYLVTSEFGTDETKTHRPHYHLIISFPEKVSLFVFKTCFERSIYNKKTGKRYFGYILQCDILDVSRGGVRYSSKYILKDQAYTNQNKIINNYIKHYTSYVNSKHGIIEVPKSQDDFFKNKCIRSTKQYKKDIETFVLPYRHMLQFYMCSNDFGCSAICERYGESLFTLGVLNIDKCPYSIPKQVIQRLERTKGTKSRDIISKSVFLSQFRVCVDDCIHRNIISKPEGEKLLFFAQHFLQPRFGCLYFVPPSGVSFWNSISQSPLRDYDELFEEYRFYDDNNYFDLRNRVLSVIALCNTKDILEFRAKLAYRKTCKEKENYELKKRNKGR